MKFIRIASLIAAIVWGFLLMGNFTEFDFMSGTLEVVFVAIGLGRTLVAVIGYPIAIVISLVELIIFVISLLVGLTVKFAKFVPVAGFVALAYFVATTIYSYIGEPWGTIAAGGGFLAVTITPTYLWNKLVPLATTIGLQPVPLTVNQTHTRAEKNPMLRIEVIASQEEFIAFRALCNLAGLWFVRSGTSWKPFGPLKYIYQIVVVNRDPNREDKS